MKKIRILLADDHPLIREGFKSLLGRTGQFEIAGEAENGSQLINMAKELMPDIILSDIRMPLVNGLDAMHAVRDAQPEIKFIILTMHEEREYILNAVRNGASGYLLKNIDGAELEKAIIAVYQGEKYFSPSVSATLAESIARPSPEQGEITPREKEVLNLVAQGLSTKLVADKLGIGIRTVESHRVNMLKKLNVSNTAELIRKAMELKLLD